MTKPHYLDIKFELITKKKGPVVSNIHCGDFEPHDEHDYSLDRADWCTGLLPCGEQIHEPHNMIFQDNAHCYGICGCSVISRTHSPRRHMIEDSHESQE